MTDDAVADAAANELDDSGGDGDEATMMIVILLATSS